MKFNDIFGKGIKIEIELLKDKNYPFITIKHNDKKKYKRYSADYGTLSYHIENYIKYVVKKELESMENSVDISQVKDTLNFLKSSQGRKELLALAHSRYSGLGLPVSLSQARESIEQGKDKVVCMFDYQGATVSVEGYNQGSKTLILTYCFSNISDGLFSVKLDKLTNLELLSLIYCLNTKGGIK